MSVLRVENIVGGWGPTTIVDELSFCLEPGEVVAILGRNGVGKTTTLELIVGRAKLRDGRIFLNDRQIHQLPIFERCHAGLGYVPQGREVFPSLTVQENLSAAARPGPWNVERLYDLFPSLRRRSESLGRQLSGGEQQMLSIARALAGNPQVLLMDEPTEGLAPIVVEEVIDAIKKLTAADSISIVLVEQIIDVALELSDRCLIMERGQIVHQAATEEYRREPARLESFLGF